MSTIRILARVLVFKLMLIALLLAAKPASAGTAVWITPCYYMNWDGPIGIYCGTLQEAARTYMDDLELYVASIGLNYTYEVLEVYAGQHNLDIHFLRSDGFNNWTQVAAYCPPGYNNFQSYVCQREGVDKKKNDCDTEAVVGNPCSAGKRNKKATEIDYSGPGLIYKRTYNSFSMDEARLEHLSGSNWRGAYDYSLTLNSQSNTQLATATLKRPDGTVIHFALTNGQYVSDSDITNRLEQTPTGWSHTLRDGTIETYDTAGRLLSITKLNGQIETLSYDTAGKLASVTGPFGHTLQFIYGTNNKIASLIDPSNAVITYTYDSNNNLERVSYPDGTAKIYHYENTTYPFHLTGISYDDGQGGVTRFSTYEYDTSGSPIQTEHATTYNGAPQESYTLVYDSPTQATVTDPAGNVEVMTFQLNLGVNNLISKTNLADGKTLTQVFDDNNRLTSRTDEEGRTTTYTYNASHQKTSMTEAAGTPQARTTTYQYLSADLDLLTLIQSPSVHAGSLKETETTYDPARNPLTITERGYTPAGTAISRTVAFTYNGFGQVLTIDGPRTDVADITTLDYYDCTSGSACGQLESTTNALGHQTHFDTYDSQGRVTQMTDHNGLVTSYTYDFFGRILTMTQTPPAGTSRNTQYVYDQNGKITSATLPDGIVLTYTYDTAQYLRSITDNVGNKVEYRYDLKGNRTSELTKDPNGTLVRSIETAYDVRNRVSSINAGGSLTQLVYDAVGNLVRTTDPNDNPDTVHTYDPLNRLIQTVDALSGVAQYGYDSNNRRKEVTPPGTAATQYTYDDLGNLLQEVSPERGTINLTYDHAGNVKTRTDARGITATYTYDALNRPLTVDYPGTESDVTFTYDSAPGCTFGMGRLCATIDASGTTTFAYDAFGNLIQQTHTELGITYTVQYTYDAGNRIQSITYPDGQTVSYSRNAVGQISAITLPINGVTTSLLNNILYRADGLITEWTFGNGLVEARNYDLQGRLITQTLGTVENRSYTHDPNGNVLTRVSSVGNSTYTYDSLNRLTGDSLLPEDTSFTYDANGNRLDLQASLDAIVGLDQGARTFTYNATGQLAQVYENGNLIATYVYNAQAQRTRKITANETILYHYDRSGLLLSESTATGNPIRKYVWVGNIPVAQIDQTVTEVLTYLHTDHLNTPRMATNSSGAVVWRWEGDAFGVAQPNSTITINLRFPGQYFDQETELHYNWNRYYNPSTGRYITGDPIGLNGGLNSYIYAKSNPLRFADPKGLNPLAACAANPGMCGGIISAAGRAIAGVLGLTGILSMSGDVQDSQKECETPKRCIYIGESLSPNPSETMKVCMYKCRGYGAIATFPWNKDLPCPPSFNGLFPGP